jgi:DNA-binding FadR family transcriptional regulator
MTKFRYPSVEEVRAMELAARRARDKELARLTRAAVRAIAQAFKRLVGVIDGKHMRHA